MVTIAALAAMGDDDRLEIHLRLGIESGLTRAQIAEAMTHLGFLRRLGQGDEGDHCGREDARRVARKRVSMNGLITRACMVSSGLVALMAGLTAAPQQPVRDGMIVMPSCTPAAGEGRPWLNKSYTPECRAKFVVQSLGSVDDKLTALMGPATPPGGAGRGGAAQGDGLGGAPAGGAGRGSGQSPDWMTERGLTRGGGSDGPAGIRAAYGATAFPTPLSVAASFDRTTAERYGDLMGEEFYAYGFTSVLGPAMDAARVWNFGRVTESFGEDPFLSGRIASAEVARIQAHHVTTMLKHYTVYNQEQGRTGDHPTRLRPAVNAQLSERALREIYLPPFKAAVEAGPGANVMCSFPRINGVYACENPHTLGILKNEWGFKGAVSPDFPDAQRSIVAAVAAGLDSGTFRTNGVNDPQSDAGSDFYGGEDLRKAVADGKISAARVDDLLMRRLVPFFAVGAFDSPAKRVADDVSTAERRAALVDVIAAGAVLLKNANRVLPLTSVRSVAIIGAQAGAAPQVVESGSANVSPTHIAPVLPAVLARAGTTTRVTYAQGTLGLEPLPIAPAWLFRTPAGEGGFQVEYFANPNFDYSQPAVRRGLDPVVNVNTMPTNLRNLPPNRLWTARWTGMFTPVQSGVQHFTVFGTGSARLSVGGKLVGEFHNAEFANHIYANLDMEAAQPKEVRVEWTPRTSLHDDTGERAGTLIGPCIRLGWSGPNRLIGEAAAAAKGADVAVVFAGMKVGEGMDRQSLALDADQDALIDAVAAANPRTVVVLQTGGAVKMPWLDKVAAVLQMWLPGDSIGPATAKLLFGDLEPGGRLPITFPRDETQGPARQARQYPGTLDAVGAVDTAYYDEGIFIGCRYWDQYKQSPLFPFGHGLSYTTFDIKGVAVRPAAGGGATVSATVTNTGSRAGVEVVQVYLGFPEAAASAPRQLKGFEKVTLKPGESRTIQIGLDADAFKYWDEQRNGWVKAAGDYTVMVGRSSRDIVQQVNLPAPRD
jgi:beta-glucosidase